MSKSGRKAGGGMSRQKAALVVQIRKNSDPEVIGAIEAITIPAMLSCAVMSAIEYGRKRQEFSALAEFSEKLFPHLIQAQREVLDTLPPKKADVVKLLTEAVIVAVEGEVYGKFNVSLGSMFHVTYWLTKRLIEIGAAGGGVDLADGSSFLEAWGMISEEMAKQPGKLEETEKSSRKRGDKMLEAFRSYGIFKPVPA